MGIRPLLPANVMFATCQGGGVSVGGRAVSAGAPLPGRSGGQAEVRERRIHPAADHPHGRPPRGQA